MRRKLFGLDLFDVIVQVIVTGAIAGITSEFLTGVPGDASVTGILAASVLLLSWRRHRALKREDRTPDSPERLEELEYRVTELESVQQRVLELEERLDFAERLLARQREPEKIPEAR